MAYKECSAEGGVSESIGFVLIFMIIIAGIGLVTLYGYPLLLEKQISADEQIMEKNIIVLQNDFKSLAYKTVPYKESSLKIGGGALTVYNSAYTPASSTISIYTKNPVTTYVKAFHSGELRYESVNAQTEISLQNGAVVKRQYFNPGSVMLAEPRWFYDSETNTLVINLITITSTDLMSRTGIGTVQMVLGETNYTYQDNINTELYMDFTPDSDVDYTTAWDNYFQNTLKTGPPVIDGTTRTYTLPTKLPDPPNGVPPAKLVIKIFEIQIKSL